LNYARSGCDLPQDSTTLAQRATAMPGGMRRPIT